MKTIVLFKLGLYALLLILSPLSYADMAIRQQANNTSNDYARLIISNEKLNGKVKLTKSRVKPKGNLVEGDVEIQNLTNKTVALHYRFDWLDKDGFAVDDMIIWEPITLGPKDIRSFSSMGKSRAATRVQFVIK